MFKATSGIELIASNGNTVVVSTDCDGNVRLCARKGKHNQSVSVISAADAAFIAAYIMSDKTAPPDAAPVGNA